MRAFRESGIGQLFFGLVVVAIILAFVLSGKGGPDLGSFKEDCAVEVGSHCIEPKEFFAAYGLIASIGLNEKAAKQMGLKELVARGLAERELLIDEATKLGIATSQDAMDAELLEGRTRVSLPAQGAERLAASLALCVDNPGGGCEPGTVGLRALPVKKNGVFDIELYKRMVRVATGRSPSLFKEMQAREFTAERMRALLTSSVRVSEEEAFLSYARARSTATARLVTLKSSWFERFVTRPLAADVDKWRAEHTDELKLAVDQAKTRWKPECPVVEEILLETRGDETREALLARALALKARVQGPAFDEQARRESMAESAALGGRVGCLDQGYGSGVDELLAGATELKKAGDVSEPIVTARGVTLLRLVARVTPETVEQLAQDYLAYKLTSVSLGQEAARKFGEELITKLGAGGDVATLTDEMTLSSLARGPLGARENPGKDHADKPLSDISRAFSIEQSPVPGAVGDSPAALVFALDKPGAVVAHPVPLQGGFAVLQLKEKDVASREKFAGDRTRIMAQLRTRKAEEALSQHVAALVEKAGGIQLNEKHVPSEKDKPSTTPKTPG